MCHKRGFPFSGSGCENTSWLSLRPTTTPHSSALNAHFLLGHYLLVKERPNFMNDRQCSKTQRISDGSASFRVKRKRLAQTAAFRSFGRALQKTGEHMRRECPIAVGVTVIHADAMGEVPLPYYTPYRKIPTMNRIFRRGSRLSGFFEARAACGLCAPSEARRTKEFKTAGPAASLPLARACSYGKRACKASIAVSATAVRDPMR